MAPRPSSPIISYRPAFITVVIVPTILLSSPLSAPASPWDPRGIGGGIACARLKLSALSAAYTLFFIACILNLYREAKTHRLAHGGPIVHSTHQIFRWSTLRGYQCF